MHTFKWPYKVTNISHVDIAVSSKICIDFPYTSQSETAVSPIIPRYTTAAYCSSFVLATRFKMT